MLGIVAGVLVTLVLWTRFAFAPAVIVLEQTGVAAGIARSWRLTSGTPFWRVLGIRLLTSILAGVAREVLTVPIGLVSALAVLATGNDHYLAVWQAAVAGVAGLITGTVTSPLTSGVDAVLYVDERIRREGLDIHLIRAAQGTAPPPWPVAAWV